MRPRRSPAPPARRPARPRPPSSTTSRVIARSSIASRICRCGVADHDLLAPRPYVEPRVVAEWPADVEQEVVGVDEEVGAAGALHVVEGGDGRADERARADRSARAAQDHTQPVLLAEALEQLLERGRAGRPTSMANDGAAELPRRVHQCDISDSAAQLRRIPEVTQLSARRHPAAGSIPAGHGARGRHRRRHRRQQPRRTTSPGSAGATSCRSTRARCPNPGGSTGHASNFIFPTDHSQGDDARSRSTASRQYNEMGVFTDCGGIEVARTRGADGGAAAAGWRRPSRGASSRRRSSRPAEVKELVPFIDERSSSAASTRRASASSTRCGPARSCASAAQAVGRAARSSPNTEVLGHRRRGRARHARVAHRPGATSRPSTSSIACGVWSPRHRARWPAPPSRSRRPCTR